MESVCKEELLESNEDDDQEENEVLVPNVKHEVKIEDNIPLNQTNELKIHPPLPPMPGMGHPLIHQMFQPPQQESFMLPPHPNSLSYDSNILNSNLHQVSQLLPQNSFSYLELVNKKQKSSE